MRSKPLSETSPVAGDAPDPVATGPGSGARADRPERSPSATPKPTRIELELSRQRSIGWTIFGLVVGGLLIARFGTVGVWGGIVLVVMGLYHGWNLIQTFLFAPGTIVVTDHEVSLPRGLCMPRPVVVPPHDITSAYLLRRSVPWNHAAPVLIVEIGARAMAFPRDWFASEADQRHVIHRIRELLRGKPDAGVSAVVAVSSDPPSG
jgi:hypothetical protein